MYVYVCILDMHMLMYDMKVCVCVCFIHKVEDVIKKTYEKLPGVTRQTGPSAVYLIHSGRQGYQRGA